MEKIRVQLVEFDKPMPNGQMISKDAFSRSEGKEIPIYPAGSLYGRLPSDVIGFGTIRSDENGIYADCELINPRIKSEDISSASIFAIKYSTRKKEELVTDGCIRAISVILKLKGEIKNV